MTNNANLSSSTSSDAIMNKKMDEIEAKQKRDAAEALKRAEAMKNIKSDNTQLLEVFSEFNRNFKDDDRALKLIVAILADPADFGDIAGLIRGDELFKEGARKTKKGLVYTAANQQLYALRRAMPAFDALCKEADTKAAKSKEVKRTSKMTDATFTEKLRAEHLRHTGEVASGKTHAEYKRDAFTEMFSRVLPIVYMLQQLRVTDLEYNKAKFLTFNGQAFDRTGKDDKAAPGTDIEQYDWNLATLSRWGKHFVNAHNVMNKKARKPRASKTNTDEKATEISSTPIANAKEFAKSIGKMDEKVKDKFRKSAQSKALLDELLIALFVKAGTFDSKEFNTYLSGLAMGHKFALNGNGNGTKAA